MTFLDRLQESLLRIWEFVPSLLGAALVLAIGYLVARLGQRAVQRLTRRVHLNEALEKGGVRPPLDPYGAPLNPSRVLAGSAFMRLPLHRQS